MLRRRCATVLLSLVAACGDDGAVVEERPLEVERVVDLGLLPLPPKAVGRDGGMSAVVGGKLLWTFGDTFLETPNMLDNSHVISASAAWSTIAAPLELTQALSGGEPAQFIPYTEEELAANRADAINGWSLWPGPPLDVGEARALVAFQLIDRIEGTGFESRGVGTATIGVDESVAMRNAALLFAPPDPLFLPTQVVGDFVYAFACGQRAALDFACKLARAPLAAADERSAYEFYDGAGWSRDVASAAYVIDRTAAPPSVSWNEHLRRYVAVHSKLLSSSLMLRTAPAVEGPWDEPLELPADGVGLLPPTSSEAFNYLYVEHPHLNGEGGRSIVVGYSRPTEPFRGDVRLARITLR